jgi:GMP synthase-like glutamine amidotransferase
VAGRTGDVSAAAGERDAGEGRADGPPWCIVQHVAHEGPGLIGQALDGAGLHYDVVRLDRGEPLPAPGALAGLVVLGGPMGVHDVDDHPWLVPERALLAATVDAGLPVLGVCLGAQQLAAALGAEVTTGPEPEVGLGLVELTGEGRRDPVLGPEYGGLSATSVPCVHWHQDTFSLPGGAVHLAGNRAFAHQAFRVGDTAYGLQFHIEVDADLARAWGPFLPEGTTLEGPGLIRVETVGRRVLRRFVDRARSAT